MLSFVAGLMSVSLKCPQAHFFFCCYCVVGFFFFVLWGFFNIPLVLWKYQHLIKLIIDALQSNLLSVHTTVS